jgi:hypothetical protein
VRDVRGEVIGRVGRSEDSSSSDIIGEDFVNPLNGKPSLISEQIHASLSLPKIKGNTTGTEIGYFCPSLLSRARVFLLLHGAGKSSATNGKRSE